MEEKETLAFTFMNGDHDKDGDYDQQERIAVLFQKYFSSTHEQRN